MNYPLLNSFGKIYNNALNTKKCQLCFEDLIKDKVYTNRFKCLKCHFIINTYFLFLINYRIFIKDDDWNIVEVLLPSNDYLELDKNSNFYTESAQEMLNYLNKISVFQ